MRSVRFVPNGHTDLAATERDRRLLGYAESTSIYDLKALAQWLSEDYQGESDEEEYRVIYERLASDRALFLIVEALAERIDHVDAQR